MSSNELSRGEFLKAGAAVVLAPYILPAADALAQLDRPPMAKALNTVLYNDPQTRSFVRDGNVDALVLWSPNWKQLEPKRGHIHHREWHKYDRVIENAGEDGCPVYVAVWSDVPDWASPAPLRAPTDRTPDGPWASFLHSIVTRHAHVRGILAMNEPNLAYIADQQQAEANTAEMIGTADEILHEAGYKGKLLVPATSDGPQFYDFTDKVLGYLQGWQPYNKVEWAHHSYYDVKENTHRRAEAVLNLLSLRQWAGEDYLWITEGGYKFDTYKSEETGKFNYRAPLSLQEHAQVHNVSNHFHWAQQTGRVAMWANYGYQDKAWGGGGFMSGLVRIDGTPHPLGKEWPRLR